MKNKIQFSIIQKNRLKIYINNNLHLFVPINKVLGINTWIQSNFILNSYFIEILVDDNIILLKYDRRNTWEEVISILSQYV